MQLSRSAIAATVCAL